MVPLGVPCGIGRLARGCFGCGIGPLRLTWMRAQIGNLGSLEAQLMSRSLYLVSEPFLWQRTLWPLLLGSVIGLQEWLVEWCISQQHPHPSREPRFPGILHCNEMISIIHLTCEWSYVVADCCICFLPLFHIYLFPHN